MRQSIQRTLFLAVSLLAVVMAMAVPRPQAEPWNVLAEREGTYLQCTRPDSPYQETLHFLVLDEAGTAENRQMPEAVLTELADHGVFPAE